MVSFKTTVAEDKLKKNDLTIFNKAATEAISVKMENELFQIGT